MGSSLPLPEPQTWAWPWAAANFGSGNRFVHSHAQQSPALCAGLSGFEGLAWLVLPGVQMKQPAGALDFGPSL